jgi:hypothetical protein
MNLEELYNSKTTKFKSIVEAFPTHNLMGPLLMSETKEYENSKIKLLIIGQETNGWGKYSENIKQGMEHYLSFDLGSEYYSSPFWNVTRKIEKILGNNKYSCAWTNLNKFDDNSDRPVGEVEKKISEIDSLLVDEIQILKPDIVIFFTSHHFDNRIKNIFKGIEFNSLESFTLNQCSSLKHKNLPKNCYRTYHPNYLRRSGLEAEFLELIKGTIANIT